MLKYSKYVIIIVIKSRLFIACAASYYTVFVGIEAMQFATKRYAKYQNRWVTKQLFERRNPEVIPPVYTFDSTNKDNYRMDVVTPAITLLG